MQKFLRTLALLALLVVPWVTQAQQTLTVAEGGTATNNHVPAYIFYFDDWTRTQYVISSENLTEMNGGTISSLTYYTTSGNIPYTTVSTVDVYLTEVSDTALSAYVPKSDATVVYSGTLEVVATDNGGELTIEFTTPYTYNGGHLLIGIDNTTDAGYKNVSFYGVSHGNAISGSNGSNPDAISVNQQNFTPTTTFTYSAGGSATTVFIGDTSNATNNSYLPMNSLYDYSYTQQIYTAEEIGGAGTINAITVWMYGNANLYTMPFDIYMLEVDKNSFTNTTDWVPVTAGDIVYSDSVTVHNTEYQPYTFTLNTPFVYSGTGNLLICFDNNTGSWKSGLNGMVFTAEDGTIRSIYARCDGTDYDPLNMTGITASGTIAARNIVVLDMVTGGGPACDRPATFAVSGVTAHEAFFSWEITSASNYILEYKPATDTVWTSLLIADSTYYLTGLTQNTVYNARVKAVCGPASESGYKTLNFTTALSCPAPTGLHVSLTPGNGTVATISWTPGGDETYWQLCMNGDLYDLEGTSDTSFSLSGLTPEQTYSIQVRAYCDYVDQSAWTDPVSFTPTNAYMLTVNDGTSTNGLVPIYGYWCDNITKSQFIIPAADLAAMQYGAINNLVFYSSDANVSWGAAEFNVYLTETSETTLSALADYSTMTQVYAGSLSIVDNVMEVTFTTPYLYMGGNLMVGFQQTVQGSWTQSNWYGVTATGASMGGYGTSISQQNFLPKTSLYFTPGEMPTCISVTNLAAGNATGSTVELSWSDSQNSGATYTVYNMADSSVVASGITATSYTVTGLNPTTNYTFGVEANCSASDASLLATVNATTACAGGNCNLYIYAEDSYGDGWNGNTIHVLQNGIAVDAYTMPTQNLTSTRIYDTATVSVCEGTPVSLSWTTGNYADEASFAVVNSLGQLVYTQSSGSNLSNGELFLTLADCASDVLHDTVAVTMAVGDAAMGTTTPAPGTYYYLDNDTLEVYATPNAGYRFVQWAVSYMMYDGLTTEYLTDQGFSILASNLVGMEGLTFTALFEALPVCNGSSCNITVVGHDSYGDGWNNGYLKLMQNDTLVGNPFTLENGSSYSGNFDVCDSYPLELVWHRGSYDAECSFSVLASNGDTLYSHNGASSILGDYTLATLDNVCTAPVAHPVHAYVAVNNIDMGWTTPVPGGYSLDATGSSLFEICAVPYTGYHFVGWELSTFSQNVFETYTVSCMNWLVDSLIAGAEAGAPITFMAMFEEDVYEQPDTLVFNMAVNDPTMGSVTPAPGTYYYTAEDEINFVATPNTGYYFLGWQYTYYEDGVLQTYNYMNPEYTNLELDAADWIWNTPVSFTAIFGSEQPSFTVVLASEDTLKGTTSPEPGTYNYEFGDVPGFSPVAEPGYVSNGWALSYYYNGSLITDSLDYVSFTLNANWFINNGVDTVWITALFTEADTMFVTLAVADSTMGTTNPAPGTHGYLNSDYIAFEAIPNAGYEFSYWEITYTEDGETVYYGSYSYNPINITLSYFDQYENFTLTAYFQEHWVDTVVFSVAVNDSTMGTVTPAPGTYTMTTDDEAYLEATANPGYIFDHWEVSFNYYGETYNYTWSYENPVYESLSYWTGYDNLTFTAVFEEHIVDTVMITLALNDSTMGSINPAPGTYYYTTDDVVTLTATPAAGYYFEGWWLNYYWNGTTHSYNYTNDTVFDLYVEYFTDVDVDSIVFTAIFAEAQYYTVNAYAQDSTMGYVTGSGVYSDADGYFTLEAVPYTGYHFVHWLVYDNEGEYMGYASGNPWTYYVGDYTCVAVFEADPTGVACSGNTCSLVVNCADTYGDGWNDGNLRFFQNDTLVAIVSMTDGSTMVDTVEVCSDYPVDLVWNSGSWDSEVSFTINSASGAAIVDITDVSELVGGFAFATISNVCTSPVVTYNHYSTTVTIAVNDSTMGTTTPAPGVYTYSDTDTLYVEAIANDGYLFDHWTVTYYNNGTLASFDDESSYLHYYGTTLVQYGPMSLTAHFVPDMYTITVSVNDSTMGYVTGSGLYSEDSVCTIEAFPYAGYYLYRWYVYDGAGELLGYMDGYNNPYSFYPNDNYTIVALFMPADSITISIAVNDATMGTTTPAPGTYVYMAGDDLTLEALPNTGYDFVGWTASFYSAGEYYSEDFEENPIEFYVNTDWSDLSNLTFTANFEQAVVPVDTLTITLAVNNAAWGTTNPVPGTYIYTAADSIAPFEAIPNDGYYFEGWTYTIDGETNTLDAEYQSFYFYVEYFLANGIDNMTLTAIFTDEEPIPDTVSVTLAVNNAAWGSITPAPGTYQYAEGSYIEVDATPAAGKYFLGWAFNLGYMGQVFGDTTITANTHYQELVDEYYVQYAEMGVTFTVTALFTDDSTLAPEPALMQVNVAVNNAAWGTTNPAPGTHYFAEGQQASVVAIPNEGYHLEGWTVYTTYHYMDETYDTLLVVLDTTVNWPVADFFDLFEGWLVEADDANYVWNVTANFVEGAAPVESDSLTLITAVNNAAWGTITPAPGTHYYVAGDSVVVNATAYSGYELNAYQLSIAYPAYGYTFDTIVYIADADAELLEELTHMAVDEEMMGMVISVTAIFQPVQGIEDVEAESFTVSVDETAIVVRGAEGKQVTFFDVNGRVLSRENRAAERCEFRVSNSGVYLVKVADAPAKRVVVVR